MKLRTAVGGILAAAALALPVAAEQAVESGAEAFDRSDFTAAAELWRKEAAAGSAEAKLGLGLIHDLGLGVPRDTAKAMRWYLEAGDDGLAEAQFNVAVMLDAGTGVRRDVRAAAVWYGRAAANGHHRAQYNLGLLYAAGEGVPQNPDLARYWLGRAAEALPAAAERLATVAPPERDQRTFTAPGVLVGAVVMSGGAERAEMVWSAAPGPPGALFLLEVVRLPARGETSGAVVLSSLTEASARVAELPLRSAAHAWRVSLVDAGRARYAAGAWRRLPGGVEDGSVALPDGRVTVRVADGDARAVRLARELAESFSGAGLWARVEPARDRADATSVRYAYRGDRDLAAEIAEFLPVLGAEDAALSPDLEAAPGEIVVRLVGGP